MLKSFIVQKEGSVMYFGQEAICWSNANISICLQWKNLCFTDCFFFTWVEPLPPSYEARLNPKSGMSCCMKNFLFFFLQLSKRVLSKLSWIELESNKYVPR